MGLISFEEVRDTINGKWMGLSSFEEVTCQYYCKIIYGKQVGLISFEKVTVIIMVKLSF